MVYIYEYFFSFIFAFAAAIFVTPVVMRLALKMGIMDVPNDDRRMHNKPIAKLGGLAMVFGFLVSMLLVSLASYLKIFTAFTFNYQFLGFFIGVIIVVIMGYIDDVRGLRARYKLLFQLAAAIVVVIFGTRIQYMTNPFSQIGFSELSPYISYPLSILWLIGITNALNFIDGLDGLAAGVTSISSISLFFVSVIFQRWDTAIITAALAGSTLGFLPYNFNPAKIFMGDTGSNFLGFTLAFISIQGTLKSYAALAIAVPILVLGLPLFDAAFAIIRRATKREPIMLADRGHLHHRLIDIGFSQKQSVIAMYIVSAVLGSCAIVLADKGALVAIILIILVSIIIIGGAKYFSESKEKETSIEADDQ